jgi:hypothetical protein
MLVIANTHAEAREYVYSKFSDGEPKWSDWNEVQSNTGTTFAGRWENDNVFGEKAELDTLRYSDDPETAEKAIAIYLKHRYADIDNYRQKLYDEGKQDILFSHNYDHEAEWSAPDSMPLYYAKKLTELLNGEWVSDSAIYDLVAWDTNLVEFRKRIDTAPEKQFLVLVDFHF